MIRLNHSVRVDKGIVTPFLVEGSNVYCFDKMKNTIIIPVDNFKETKKRRKLIIPVQTAPPPIIPVAIEPEKIIVENKPEEPVEEIIIIKPIVEAKELSYTSLLKIKVSGEAKTSYSIVEYKPPPIIDNSRYVRPSLNDEYI